jgi:hypothetical protein
MHSGYKTVKAYKIISMFVEVGSRFENNMRSSTRDQLIQFKESGRQAHKLLFELVKLEIMADILQNPDLRRFLELTSGRAESMRCNQAWYI